MKKLISFFLALTILLAAFCAFAEEPAANPAIHYEGAGFDTPEDAVACYMNGLKNLDFEQMLSAYAWETLASHYSVEKFLQRIKAYIPTSYVRMPAANDFMVSATLHSLRAGEVRMIYNALEAYILGEDYPDGKTIPLQEEKDVEAFLQKFDNSKLEALTGMADITFLTPDSVTDNMFSLEQNQEADSSVRGGRIGQCSSHGLCRQWDNYMHAYRGPIRGPVVYGFRQQHHKYDPGYRYEPPGFYVPGSKAGRFLPLTVMRNGHWGLSPVSNIKTRCADAQRVFPATTGSLFIS